MRRMGLSDLAQTPWGYPTHNEHFSFVLALSMNLAFNSGTFLIREMAEERLLIFDKGLIE